MGALGTSAARAHARTGRGTLDHVAKADRLVGDEAG
jgi:hypothetical protein